jgi:hypothetical protein
MRQSNLEIDSILGDLYILQNGLAVSPAIQITIGPYSTEFTPNDLGCSRVFRHCVIGYRIDSGKLQPIWYEGTLSTRLIKYENANIVEIFAKDDTKTGEYAYKKLSKIEKIQIEPKLARLTFYFTNSFPDK